MSAWRGNKWQCGAMQDAACLLFVFSCFFAVLGSRIPRLVCFVLLIYTSYQRYLQACFYHMFPRYLFPRYYGRMIVWSYDRMIRFHRFQPHPNCQSIWQNEQETSTRYVKHPVKRRLRTAGPNRDQSYHIHAHVQYNEHRSFMKIMTKLHQERLIDDGSSSIHSSFRTIYIQGGFAAAGWRPPWLRACPQLPRIMKVNRHNCSICDTTVLPEGT